MHSLELQQFAHIYPADTQTPISLYMDLVGDEPGILLESAEVDGRLGRYSLIAWDFRLVLDCLHGRLRLRCQDQRLDPLKHFDGQEFLTGLEGLMEKLHLLKPDGFKDLPGLTRSLAGSFGYGLSALLEPALRPHLDPDSAHCVLALPGQQILFDHLHQRCIYLSLDQNRSPESRPRQSGLDREPCLGPVVESPDRDDFCQGVSRTKELINSGEAIQVVLSTRFQAPFSGDPFILYRRLRQANPSPYMFYLRLPETTIVGSSPELMVRSSRNQLQLRPIAGTRPRGRDDQEDRRLAEELLNDDKERAEHVMLVDLGRNDLGRIAQPGSVQVERFMQVERFSHVMHLTSYISAGLLPECGHMDVLRAAFPAGTVSGAPKIRAMQIIADTEPFERGPYAGAIGWLGLDPGQVSLDTGITIRSFWIEDGQMTWQSGAGIVSDSEPEREWEECQNKSRVIRHILNQKEDSDAFARR